VSQFVLTRLVAREIVSTLLEVFFRAYVSTLISTLDIGFYGMLRFQLNNCAKKVIVY